MLSDCCETKSNVKMTVNEIHVLTSTGTHLCIQVHIRIHKLSHATSKDSVSLTEGLRWRNVLFIGEFTASRERKGAVWWGGTLTSRPSEAETME